MNTNCENIGKHHFPAMLKQLSENTLSSLSLGVAGFQATGIWPFERSKVKANALDAAQYDRCNGDNSLDKAICAPTPIVPRPLFRCSTIPSGQTIIHQTEPLYVEPPTSSSPLISVVEPLASSSSALTASLKCLKPAYRAHSFLRPLKYLHLAQELDRRTDLLQQIRIKAAHRVV